MTILRGITEFSARGYTARRVESPITSEPVWHIATPNGVRLRGDYDTVDEVLDAIDAHSWGPSWARPEEEATPQPPETPESPDEHSSISWSPDGFSGYETGWEYGWQAGWVAGFEAAR